MAAASPVATDGGALCIDVALRAAAGPVDAGWMLRQFLPAAVRPFLREPPCERAGRHVFPLLIPPDQAVTLGVYGLPALTLANRDGHPCLGLPRPLANAVAAHVREHFPAVDVETVDAQALHTLLRFRLPKDTGVSFRLTRGIIDAEVEITAR